MTHNVCAAIQTNLKHHAERTLLTIPNGRQLTG